MSTADIDPDEPPPDLDLTGPLPPGWEAEPNGWVRNPELHITCCGDEMYTAVQQAIRLVYRFASEAARRKAAWDHYTPKRPKRRTYVPDQVVMELDE